LGSKIHSKLRALAEDDECAGKAALRDLADVTFIDRGQRNFSNLQAAMTELLGWMAHCEEIGRSLAWIATKRRCVNKQS